MRAFYLMLFLISSISLLLSIKPIPSSIPLPDRLAANSEKWDIDLNDKNFNIDLIEAKKSVIELITNHSPSKSDPLLIYSFAITAIFSFLGFTRETKFMKRQA